VAEENRRKEGREDFMREIVGNIFNPFHWTQFPARNSSLVTHMKNDRKLSTECHWLKNARMINYIRQKGASC
jgi:hypothetical protein